MPTSTRVEPALQKLRRTDPAAASDAEAATGWLVGEEGDLADVGELHLCEFLWYALPTKFLVSLPEHIAVARAVGALFSSVGLTRQADLCTSPTTVQVLRAWDAGDDQGYAAYHRALAATGLVPPDVPELRWGEVMGVEEATIQDRLSEMLESAIAEGRIRLTAATAERDRVRLTRDALTTSRGADGRTWLAVVETERITSWVSIGGEARRRLAAALLPLILERPALPADAAQRMEPLRWLLARAAAPDGLPLTEGHNLARTVVADALSHFPGWAESAPGTVRNEHDLLELSEARLWMHELGALRRRQRRLLITRRGRELLADVEALWAAVTTTLLPADPGMDSGFSAACGEATLLLLSGGTRIAHDELRHSVVEMIRGRGWRRASGEPVSELDVAGVSGQLYRRLRTLGLYVETERRWIEGDQLSATGVIAALAALRGRAVQPVSLPAF